MESLIRKIEAKSLKSKVADVKSGDTVRVHQKIREGGKERVQIFNGTVIRTNRPKSLTASITVRRIASGVGVEKTFPLHSPAIIKIDVTKRSKVRRNYLSYLRQLSGKGARLTGVEFDRDAANQQSESAAEVEEAKIKAEQAAEHEAEAAQKAKAEAKEAAKFEEAVAQHEEKQPKVESPEPEADKK